MKTHTFTTITAALLVASAITIAVFLHKDQIVNNMVDTMPFISVAKERMSAPQPESARLPSIITEMDVAQIDEVAKLGAYPLYIPPFTGELDVAQQDEVSKLSAYPIPFAPLARELDVAQQDEFAKLSPYPLVIPPFSGELDVAQQDEVAKRGW